MRIASAFSPGKIILSGEHSIVYRGRALVSSVDLGIQVEIREGGLSASLVGDPYFQHIVSIFENRFDKNVENLSIKVQSDLPPSSGLGSSAAFASSLLSSLAEWHGISVSKDNLFNLVLEAEKFMHGTSSGVDPSAVVYRGFLIFEKDGEKLKYSKMDGNFLSKGFFLVNSGRAEESTKEMVDFVRAKVEKDRSVKKIIGRISETTEKIIQSIKEGGFNPELITENHRLLDKLGVVGSKAREIISLIENSGGFAKITGAGGIKNGSGFILAYYPDNVPLVENLKYLPLFHA